MASIELQNIAHAYTKSPDTDGWAIKPDLSHTWEDGGSYALLGPSGCGKTTLLSIISGLLSPTRGRILFDGKDVSMLPTEKRNITQVFQFPVVYDTMTVRENLAFPLRNRGASEQDINTRIKEVATLLEMPDILDKRAGALSPDAKQIVALGRGLVRADVGAILFDEPLTVIDPHIKWRLRSNLKQLRSKTDFTMIYVTHDQTEALTFADRIIVMHEGSIVQIGPPAELFARPQHTFVGYFIGSPGMNIIPCKIDGGGAYLCGRRVANAPVAPSSNDKIELGVRPEFVRFADDGIPATVHSVRDLGRRQIVTANIDGAELKMAIDEHISVPSHPKIAFDSEHTFVYINSKLAGDSP